MKKNDHHSRIMRLAAPYCIAKPIHAGGYTLIEAVISLAIFATVLVPLIYGVFRNSTLAASHRELTGIRLIEREAAIARTFPGDILPTHRTRIGNDEWTVTTETTGNDPLQYRMIASLRGRAESEARFFGRPATKQ